MNRRGDSEGISLEVMMGLIVVAGFAIFLFFPVLNKAFQFFMNKPDQGSINSLHNLEQDILDLSRKPLGTQAQVPYYIASDLSLALCEAKGSLCLYKQDKNGLGQKIDAITIGQYHLWEISLLGKGGVNTILGNERVCGKNLCNLKIHLEPSKEKADRNALFIEDMGSVQ